MLLFSSTSDPFVYLGELCVVQGDLFSLRVCCHSLGPEIDAHGVN